VGDTSVIIVAICIAVIGEIGRTAIPAHKLAAFGGNSPVCTCGDIVCNAKTLTSRMRKGLKFSIDSLFQVSSRKLSCFGLFLIRLRFRPTLTTTVNDPADNASISI
jgi:hypothetical protein